MKTYIDTYSQVDFLDNFYTSLNPGSIGEMFLKEGEVTRVNKIFKLLNKDANLFLNCDSDSFKNKVAENNYYKYLMKQSLSGGSKLHFSPEKFENLEWEKICLEGDSRSIFLLRDEEEVDLDIKNKYGMYATGIASLNDDQFLFRDNWTLYISPDNETNQFSGWQLIKKLKAPSSFLVIADNYCLDKNDSFQYNIYEILKNCLPTNLISKTFDIAIIVQRYDLSKAKTIYNKISDFISSLNLPYKWNLAIYLTGLNDPHDRNIITNYYWIHSGHSFDYYDVKGKINKKTTLHFHSLINNCPTMSSQLRSFSEIFKKSKADFDRLGNVDIRFQ